jgi:hypothetical protein
MKDGAGGELLPLPLATVREASIVQDSAWQIGWLDDSHPALTPLVTPASVYQSVNVYKHVQMTLSDKAAVRVLARLNDGEPLLVSRTSGQGSVLMLGTSAQVDWSNLPLRPLFMPLMLRLAFHLAGAETAQPQLIAGAPLVLEASGPAVSIEITGPSGETVRRQHDSPTAGQLRYEETHEVGIYQVRRLGRDSQVPRAYALNLDPAETDSARLSRRQLEGHFGARPVIFCDDPLQVVATIERLRQGESLWEFFLIAVLVTLVAETFLANRRPGAPSGLRP